VRFLKMSQDAKTVAYDTYSIDPQNRCGLSFKMTDNAEQRADKITRSLKDDLYYARLRQLVIDGMTSTKKSKGATAAAASASMSSKKQRDGNIEGTCARVMEEMGLKQALANITSRLHTKGVASMGSSSSSSKSAVNLASVRALTRAAEPPTGTGNGRASGPGSGSGLTGTGKGTSTGEGTVPPDKAPSCASPAYHASDEMVESIRESRLGWAQGIEEEVHAMTLESGRPFAVLRPIGEMNRYCPPCHATSRDTSRSSTSYSH
jgi:hypothetical protein